MLTCTQLLDPLVEAREGGRSLSPTLLLTLVNLVKIQRLAKWFTTLSPKVKAKIIKDVSQLVLSRRTRMCNFLEYKGS